MTTEVASPDQTQLTNSQVKRPSFLTNEPQSSLPLSTDAHPAASNSAESAANADGASDRSTNPTTGP